MAKEKKEVEVTEEEDEIVQLVDDNGKTNDFYFLGTMDFEGTEYSFFQPVDENEDGDIVIFKIVPDEEDEESVQLLPIDDELANRVFDAYQEEYQKEFGDDENK